MTTLFLVTTWACLTASLVKGQSMMEGRKMMEQLKALPFSTNPFFIRTMADSGKFDGNGTEGIKPRFGGYFCDWVGNLNCTDDYKFQCEGAGIVDCTGTCPGDEDTVKSMMSMIEDPELMEKFPIMAEFKNKFHSEGGEGKKRFEQVLRGCKFGGILALLELADSGGIGSEQNGTVSHVDESAVSGFGDYDYDDYYDDDDDSEDSTETEEEVEMTKDEVEIMPEARSQINQESKQMEIHIADKKRSMSSSQEESDSNLVPNNKEMSHRSRIPKEADEEQQDHVLERGKRALEQLEEEVALLKRSFRTALYRVGHKSDMTRRKKVSKRSTRIKRVRRDDEQLVQLLAEQMQQMAPEQLRKIRQVTDDMSIDPSPEYEACQVKNLSCVTFPTTAQCQGISLGGCISTRQFLAMIFSPRVIVIVVAVISGLIICGVALAYYFYRRKNRNQVDPVCVTNDAGVIHVVDGGGGGGGGAGQGGEDPLETTGDVQRVKQVPYNANKP